MNQPPNYPPNDDFDRIVSSGYDMSSTYQPDPQPYGIPAHSIPAKPGLTKRGKVAIAVGTAVLATGGLIFWQHSNTVEATNQARQQEYQLEKAKLDLEMVKEINRAAQDDTRDGKSADSERNKQIAACVNADKGLVGKQMGVTYSSVLKDCQDQAGATTSATTSAMQTAADSTGTNSNGAPSEGLLIAGAVLVLGLGAAARKATRSNQA